MSSILKFLKTIRNHWKKTTFAACAVTYGANYAKESYEIQNLMEKYCQEALSYGTQSLQPSENPRKVLIVLNPTANRRKAVKQFEQYCVPILHLAGICVDVVQTKSEGHARTILEEHKDKTDAIIIAGGDGTISEGVTGILRRADNNILIETCPIGVLPLGRQNMFAQSLFHTANTNETLNQVRRLADASLAIVKAETKQADVIKIEIKPSQNQDGDHKTTPGNKPVFALTGVEWGSYRDAHVKREKYWYFGRLRKYATYIFNGYKANINWHCAADIAYYPPCSGCSNCYKQFQDDEMIVAPVAAGGERWWSSFVQKNQLHHQNAKHQKRDELKLIVNENCSNSTVKSIATTDFHLTVQNNEIPELVLDLGPPANQITYWDFVREGWAAENGGKRTISERINARQIDVYPNQVDQSQFYSIDNEEFEVKPIRVTLLPKMIKIFCMDQQ